jgi:DNA-binding MarR family transcriptional regulator
MIRSSNDMARNRPRTTSDDDITIVATRGLVRLSRQVEIKLSEFQLSVSQFRVLDRLYGGSAAGRSLAEWLAVKPPSITALVDGLVSRGLVRRTGDPTDRRRVTHELTSEGRALHAEALSALAARLSHLHSFVADEVDDAIEVLATWNQAIEMAREAKQLTLEDEGNPK